MKDSINNKLEVFDKYELEQFADIRILRYAVPGFEDLSLRQKKLLYYLGEAALCGRDILADQNCRYNLLIRKTLEVIYNTYKGERKSEWNKFEVYLKRVWFSNGIHHHYSSDKIAPEFDNSYFEELISKSDINKIPVFTGYTPEQTMSKISAVIFDKDLYSKKVWQDTSSDIVNNSAVNFYADDVTQKEIESFYSSKKNVTDSEPLSHGLNSKVIKKEGQLFEQVWKIGGMYSPAIEKIVFWLEKAVTVAETKEQEDGLRKLIEYYTTGSLEEWDAYNIIWVKDLQSQIDYVNGFVEVYGDPMGMKATWESIVNFKDVEATKRTEIISDNAQWFEDNSPIDEVFKKSEVKGVSAKVITVSMLGGDCYPHTPIGINLPNSDWIRKEHGSKSVTIENITYAYAQADLSSGFLEEFSENESDMELERKYGPIANNLHTDLHECLGHGSGQLLPGVNSEALKNYHSPLEETRADLFALYYMMDPIMVELGLLPSLDAAKAHYISYIRNGYMTQLRRIEPGKSIEQAHMRNRQLITKWVFEKGENEKIVERIKRNNKTYLKINDFDNLRQLFGTLLKEVQRIKSEGDYSAGKELVERYGVKVDSELHKEVLERFESLKLPAFSGFVNPEYIPVIEDDNIVDIKINYIDDYAAQMLNYSTKYSFLPVEN